MMDNPQARIEKIRKQSSYYAYFNVLKVRFLLGQIRELQIKVNKLEMKYLDDQDRLQVAEHEESLRNQELQAELREARILLTNFSENRDHTKSVYRVIKLKEELKAIMDELGVPNANYPTPVANAFYIAKKALEKK